MLTHAGAQQGVSPGPPASLAPQVTSSSAVTDWPSSASLLPCSAFRSDSNRPIRVEHHGRSNVSVVVRGDPGGSKLGSSTVSERVCGEKSESSMVKQTDGGNTFLFHHLSSAQGRALNCPNSIAFKSSDK